MKNDIRMLAICGGVLAVAGLTASVQASVSEAEAGGAGGSWAVTPTYLAVSGTAPNSFATPEGNWAATAGGGINGQGALSESFQLNSGQAGTLSSIQFVLGGAATTFNLELYDLGTYTAPAGSATYYPGSQVDLLSSGLQFTYGASVVGANEVVLTFSGADAVTLNANDYYVFQLDPVTHGGSGGTVQWYRGSSTQTGLGQMYREGQFNTDNTQMGALNGGIRNASFALTTTPAPEPTTLALAGLGGLASLVALRRKK
jgi:hypothetical protein